MRACESGSFRRVTEQRDASEELAFESRPQGWESQVHDEGRDELKACGRGALWAWEGPASLPGWLGALCSRVRCYPVYLTIALEELCTWPPAHFRQELVPGLGPASCFGGPGIPTSLPQGGSSYWGWDGGCRGEAQYCGPASPKTLQSKRAAPRCFLHPPP